MPMHPLRVADAPAKHALGLDPRVESGSPTKTRANIVDLSRPSLTPPHPRIGPLHPRLGAAGFRAARWLSARLMSVAGFHQLCSGFADQRITQIRERLRRGETVYLAGLGAPGTHNSGVA